MQTLPRRRRTLAAVALLVAAPVVTGCGFDVGTDAIYQPAEGSNARSASVDVLGAVVVSSSNGSGRLIATFVEKRNETDQVTGISGRGVQVTGPESIEVPSNSVGFANLADTDVQPVLVSGDDVKAGGYLRMRFSFSGSRSASLDVPVVDATGTYSGLAPGQQAESDAGSGVANEVATSGSQGALTAGGGS